MSTQTDLKPPRRAVRGDRLIQASATATVVAIGGIAGVVSYRHALEVVGEHGETGLTTYLTPLTVDGLVFTASMTLLHAARAGHKPPLLARFALGMGIAATVAVNILHGLAHGPIGALVAAWPAVTLVLVVELLMGMIRARRTTAVPDRTPERCESGDVPAAFPAVPVPDPDVPEGPRPRDAEEPPAEMTVVPDVEQAHAAEVFAAEVAAGVLPSIRRIRGVLRCGQPKAARVRAYLATLPPQTGSPAPLAGEPAAAESVLVETVPAVPVLVGPAGEEVR